MSDSQDAEASRGFHVEWFFGDKLGAPILVRCWCEIGHDHSYSDWVERYHKAAEQ